MRNIDRFILHVTHNLFPLSEYYEKEIKFLMDKFKEEAEDLNIQISDEQLKKYIERFDQLKNSTKVTDKDLRKYSLSKLIKLVTSSPGAELPDEEEEEEDTPDVVYNENDIIIWNGAKQGNCIVYGASQKIPGGSKWCITEPGGSWWGKYRYGSGSPTFYLAKNNNLSDNDKLSFVAIQVLDNGLYKFTNRYNNPGSEGPFDWEELNKRVPWLKDVSNIKNILKPIPFSKKEKETELFRNNPLSIKQWMKEPFNTKKQYLLVRAGVHSLFKDISNDTFISTYLPKYPDIASVIARTPGVININELMQHLDKFSKQDQSSIVKQIQTPFTLSILDGDVMFDLKKYLVKTNKILLKQNERLYVTSDNQAIVLLTLGEDSVRVGLYTEDDEYPNIKLNKRTSKYLLDYPELDKIPLRNLFRLVEDNVIDKEFIDNLLNKAKKDPDSALVIKSTEDGEIVLDSNTFSSYKVGADGKLTPIPFDSEEVQQAFDSAKDNKSFQQNALNLFKTEKDLPESVDKTSLLKVINAIPYSQRIIPTRFDESPMIVLTTTEPNEPFFYTYPAETAANLFYQIKGNYNKNGRFSAYGVMSDAKIPAYHAYLRSVNKSFNDAELQGIFKSPVNSYESKIKIVRNNMPVNADNRYKPVMMGNDVILINTENPRQSLMLSRSRNNLKQFNLPPQAADQLLGRGPAPGQIAAQVGGVARRGRPAGAVANVRAPRPQQPVAAGNINVGERMQAAGLTNGFLALPRSIRNRLNVTNARASAVITNRGASRRQNLLGNAGRVTAVLEIGPSAIYFIQLNNGATIASIVAQPGNTHYIVTPQSAFPLISPAQLLQVLQQRNLAEVYKYITNEYFDRNPNHLSEFRQLLRQHINEKKKQNENK